MKGHTRYFMIAGFLTILNAAVIVYYGLATWKACSGDIWDRALLVLFASLGPTSLVNVWAWAVTGPDATPGGRNEECVRGMSPIPAEVRGSGNV